MKIFNGIQYASVFSATLVGICYSFWVIIGLAWNPDHQNKYKDIILVLTVTHFLTCAFYAPLIPVSWAIGVIWEEKYIVLILGIARNHKSGSKTVV